MRRLPSVVLLALSAAPIAAQCPPPGGYGNPGQPPATPPPTGWVPNSGPSEPTGPTTPRPTGPTAPAPTPAPARPAGPTTGGILPTAPVPAPAGPRTNPRGLQLEDDLTTWDHWWEFNQDAYLQLHRSALTTVATGNDNFYLGATRRSERDADTAVAHTTIVSSIVPALKKALDDSKQREVTTACLLALGRIGVQPPDWKLVDVLAARIDDSDQSVRENAAVALGLAAATDTRAVDLLIGLSLDDAVGRKLRGEGVEDRTRTFAIYGLGLAAGASADLGIKERALNTLTKVLAADDGGSRNVKVATISAIGSLGLRGRRYQEVKLAERALQTLTDYFGKEFESGERFVQAHVPTALARLLGRDHARSDAIKELLAAELVRRDGRRMENAVAQSCALALGQLVAPNDDDDAKVNPDVAHSKLLLEVATTHRDVQTRNFAVLALGQIGGACNRKALLNLFDRANASQERPWCALALGVMAFARGEAGRATTGAFVADRFVGETLFDAVRKTRDPMIAGAFAIASGLAGANETASVLRQRLLASTGKEKFAGELAISLALLGDRGAIEDLQRVVADASQRPELLERAAVALGRLGDASIVATLERRLMQSEGNVATVQAAAAALSQIGDHRAVAGLVQVLGDTGRSSVQRAGAATALGGIADPRTLPWNTIYSANTNYRAAPETMVDAFAGVLDLL